MALTIPSKMKKNRSRKKLNRTEKIALNLRLVESAEELLNYFGIEYTHNGTYLSMTCPIHDGADNPTATSICIDPDDSVYGLWRCWTRGCQQKYSHDMLGLVQGIMESRKDGKIAFSRVVSFCIDFTESNIKDLKVKESGLSRIDKLSKAIQKKKKIPEHKISRTAVRKSLIRPAKYYLKRGYKEEILDKFDVGICLDKSKQMYNRVVAPVYDDEFNYMVGCVGRVQHEEYNGRKWINSKHFHTSVYLYGYWLAKDKIRETKSVVLVEGQGDVWRLHEAGIENAVGIFGSSLSDAQVRTLETSGAFNIIILTDNDEAGKKARESIKEKCSRIFNILEPIINHKDVGDMTVDQITSELKPQLEGLV